MKQSTYNYIKECIAMGHWVAVRHTDNLLRVVMYETKNGELQGTYSANTLGNALDFGLAAFSWSEQEMLERFTDEIQVIPRVPKLLKEGDECIILDTPEIREYAKNDGFGWGKSKIKMIGTKQKISSLYTCKYYIGGYDFPFFMVAPVPPQENKLAELDSKELIEELKRRGDIVEGSVVK